MLSDITSDPVIKLDDFSLHELTSVLQKLAKDPFFNDDKVRSGSYIANYVLREMVEL